MERARARRAGARLFVTLAPTRAEFFFALASTILCRAARGDEESAPSAGRSRDVGARAG